MKTFPRNYAPCIPDNAPFSSAQRQWLNGFLAGLYTHAENRGGSAEQESADTTSVPLLILYGSQTGNAESAAKKLFKRAKSSGFTAELFAMDAYPKERLKTDKNLLLVTSTYGEGSPPDNAESFFTFLHSNAAPRLDETRFSVMGFGDKNYPGFNVCAKRFDKRLEELGAARVVDGVYADVDFESDFASWQEAVLLGMKGSSPNGTVGTTVSDPLPVAAKATSFNRANPFKATVIANSNLNREGSSKETRHIEFSLEGSGLAYEAGDALGVWPSNNVRMADELIAASGFEPHEPAPLPDKKEAPLIEALQFHYDISGLTMPFLMACARLSKSSKLKELVGNEAASADYMKTNSLIDLVKEFQIIFPTTEYLIAPLRQIQPRLYSISSSPKAHTGKVHITVGVLRYTVQGRQREGLCSNFLARSAEGVNIPVYIHPNKMFRVPDDPSRPLIMVGPGTGIAPFRAFLEERKATGATGKNWLFFGDQKSDCDFLYRDQLVALKSDGVLNKLDTAFSRDQTEKIYVQDRMKSNARELYAWLEEGATFCVCGDASRMAKDVDSALHEIITETKGCSADEAAEYVARLKSEKRYLRDVY